MAELYELAHNVVIWLGPESKNSKLALATLDYFGKQVECAKDGTRMKSPCATEEEWFMESCRLPYDQETWDAISDIIQRPWFDRLWVLQEAQLANFRTTIQCGRDECSWPSFRRAIDCITEKDELPSARLRERLDYIQRMARDPHQSFLKTLSFAFGRKCSDPRDRVYALLGILPSTMASRIRPDYSLSAAEVYKELFLLHLGQVLRLEMIRYSDLAERQIDGPTWVPDLSYEEEDRWSLSHGPFASGFSRSHWTYLSPDILEVCGVQCATLSTVSTPAPNNLVEALAAVRLWEPTNLHTSLYITGESLLDAYSLTLRKGGIKERWPVGEIDCTLEHWKSKVCGKMCLSTESRSDTDVNDLEIHESLKYVRRRTLVTTQNGYIGLAPKAAQQGERLLSR